MAYRYGRRMDLVSPVVLGIALMVCPWFVRSTLWLVVLGGALTAALWVLRE